MTQLQPRSTPCGTCPYRQDCPSGLWAGEDYRKLTRYDADTGEHPLGVFMCHDARDEQTICRGWLDTHPKEHLLALRLRCGRDVDPSIMTLPLSGTPVFSSGLAAAMHGMRDINDPPPQTLRMIDKLHQQREERESSSSG